MKGKINFRGNLWIERAGVMKEQICPLRAPYHETDDISSYREISCGDHCPLFMVIGRTLDGEDLTVLTLSCGHNSVLIFDEFTDERGDNAKQDS